MEQDRPDVQAKRRKFRRLIKTVKPSKLVCLDESGANTSMGRSHAWIRRGEELIDPRPMNWGTNLTMIGAIRKSGLVTMGTMFQTANGDRFCDWVRRRLSPHLRRGDVVLMDNARAHHDPRVRPIITKRGARLEYLPPYSPDFNPIEPAWALIKKEIKRQSPRSPAALRRVAHNARRKIHVAHCVGWFEHAGYVPIRK